MQLIGEQIDKRLKFRTEPCNDNDHKSFYSIIKTPDIDHNVWHKQLVYINNQYLFKMNNNNLIDGTLMTITF